MAKAKNLISIELEDFLSTQSSEAQGLTLELRDLVLGMAPEAIEQIDVSAHLLAYGYAKTYKHLICVIILYKDYVNLGFPRGVDLPDPNRLLQGTGKKARHVKVKSKEQITSLNLRALVQASIDATPHPEEAD